MPIAPDSAVRRSRLSASLLILALALTGLSLHQATTAAPASAATGPRVIQFTAPTTVTINQRFVIRGNLTTRGAKKAVGMPVILQERLGTAWRELGSIRTWAGGVFSFDMSLDRYGTRRYRVVAPAIRMGSRHLPRVVSSARVVKVPVPAWPRFLSFEKDGTGAAELNATTTFRGRVSGGTPGDTITVSARMIETDSVVSGSARMTADRTFSVGIRFRRLGHYHVTASIWPPNAPASVDAGISAVEVVERAGAFAARGLTTLPSNALLPDVSSDQRYISYALADTDEEGRPLLELRSRAANTVGEWMATIPGSADELRSLDLSADGSTLAAVVRARRPGVPDAEDGRLYVWRVRSSPLLVSTTAGEAVLNADGSRVAYTHVSSSGLSLGIQVEGLQSGPVAFLSVPLARSITMSADGSKVTYLRTSDAVPTAPASGQVEMWRVSDGVGDDAITRVSATSSGEAANGPSANPIIASDGTAITFSSTATDLVQGGGAAGLYRYDVASGTRHLIAAAPPGTTRMVGVSESTGATVAEIPGTTTLALYDGATRGRTLLLTGLLRSRVEQGEAPWLMPSADGRAQPFLRPTSDGITVGTIIRRSPGPL